MIYNITLRETRVGRCYCLTDEDIIALWRMGWVETHEPWQRGYSATIELEAPSVDAAFTTAYRVFAEVTGLDPALRPCGCCGFAFDFFINSEVSENA